MDIVDNIGIGADRNEIRLQQARFYLVGSLKISLISPDLLKNDPQPMTERRL